MFTKKPKTERINISSILDSEIHVIVDLLVEKKIINKEEFELKMMKRFNLTKDEYDSILLGREIIMTK